MEYMYSTGTCFKCNYMNQYYSCRLTGKKCVLFWGEPCKNQMIPNKESEE